MKALVIVVSNVATYEIILHQLYKYEGIFIYVGSASISQPQNQALGSILKLSMKVFSTNVKNVIIRQTGYSL